MLVSVIVPMRNAEPFVAETLRSLLAQNGVELQLLVVNDGSTDRSAAIVREINDSRIELVEGPQRGISAAFNAGLAAARGDFLCRCDADDLYPPGRLAEQVAWLESHPDFVAVCGGYETITQRGGPIDSFVVNDGRTDVTDDLLHGRGRSHMSAYLFCTEAVRKIGGCREWFQTSEDADLQFRLAEVGRVGYVPTIAYRYRLHDASITHQVRSKRREFFADAATRFAEQRRVGGEDDLSRGNPPEPPEDVGHAGQSTNDQVFRMLSGRAWKLHGSGRRWEAIKSGLHAAMLRPTRPSAWKAVAALMLKPAGR